MTLEQFLYKIRKITRSKLASILDDYSDNDELIDVLGDYELIVTPEKDYDLNFSTIERQYIIKLTDDDNDCYFATKAYYTSLGGAEFDDLHDQHSWSIVKPVTMYVTKYEES
jgi:hypothetical protein